MLRQVSHFVLPMSSNLVYYLAEVKKRIVARCLLHMGSDGGLLSGTF